MTGFAERPRIAQGRVDPTLRPGEPVEIIGGPHRGSSAVVEDWDDIPTPSGSWIRLVRVRRPRAGVSWEFPDMVRRSAG
jgi:hypothetical protein